MTTCAGRLVAASSFWVLAAAAAASGPQEPPPIPVGGAFGPVAVNAPYSAEATTTVRPRLADDGLVEITSRARYFRDIAGRVRVEQEIGASPGRTRMRIMIRPDVTTDMVVVLDPDTRIWHPLSRWFADQTSGGGYTFALPLAPTKYLLFHRGDYMMPRYRLDESAVLEEPLGSRRIEGVDAVGRRIVTTIPAGREQNPHPIQIIDERWESIDLQLLLFARHSDPRTADIEYRITRLDRSNPGSALFEVPADLSGATSSLELVFAEAPENARLSSRGLRREAWVRPRQ